MQNDRTIPTDWLLAPIRARYSLLPLMPGHIAKRAAIRLPAAQLLAQFHQAALAYPDRSPRPNVPA